MKITKVRHNNHKKTFEIHTRTGVFLFPYSLTKPAPTVNNKIAKVIVDKELNREGFTYELESGAEGSIHLDHILEYNKDPNYLADMVLYNLTLEAQKRVQKTKISTREIARRLGTSLSQLYRLLDQTNTKKSVRQMLSLLFILGCDIDLTIRPRSKTKPA